MKYLDPKSVDEENFEELLAEELRTDEWTFWEHYEAIEYKDSKKLKDE